MKKRFLSIFMAAALCISSATPSAVSAETNVNLGSPTLTETAAADWIDRLDLNNDAAIFKNLYNTLVEASNYDPSAVPSHTHTYEAYECDASGHWQLCTDSSCPDTEKGKTTSAVHSFNNNSVSCDTCNYTKSQEAPPSVTIYFSSATLVFDNYNSGDIYRVYNSTGNLLEQVENVNTTTISDNWFGTTISVVRCARDNNYLDSNPVELTLPVRPELPNIKHTFESAENAKDAKVLGLDPTKTYEYKIWGTDESTFISGVDEITGLTANTYDIRLAATDNNFASIWSAFTIDTHSHIENEYIWDITEHWKSCDNSDCPAFAYGKIETEAHVFDNNSDADCNTCGYLRTVTPDSETPDSETPDSETPDSETPDSETPDLETPDSETPDSETPDSETPDSETPDSEIPDSETPDSETPDSETPDSETPDSEIPDSETPDSETPDSETPDSETPDSETPDSETPDSDDDSNTENDSEESEKPNIPTIPELPNTKPDEPSDKPDVPDIPQQPDTKPDEPSTEDNSTLVFENGKFVCYTDGVKDTEKHAIITYDGAKFLVAHGEVATHINGLAQDPQNPDVWYHCTNGQVDSSFTGVAEYDNAYFYVQDGIMNTNLTGFVNDGTNIFYIASGRILTEVTGLAPNIWSNDETKTWYYVENGKINTSLTGFYTYDTGMFYVQNGILMINVNGFLKDSASNTAYYLANGQVQTQYTGPVIYDNVWFYVQNGILAEDFTGNIIYQGKTFYVENGMLKH